MLFVVGDYFAGMAVGVGAALAVRGVVAPGMDLVIAMLLGMAVGMIVHLVIGFALTPVLGMFQTMMPASLIGLYGGMLVAMRSGGFPHTRCSGDRRRSILACRGGDHETVRFQPAPLGARNGRGLT